MSRTTCRARKGGEEEYAEQDAEGQDEQEDDDESEEDDVDVPMKKPAAATKAKKASPAAGAAKQGKRVGKGAPDKNDLSDAEEAPFHRRSPSFLPAHRYGL